MDPLEMGPSVNLGVGLKLNNRDLGYENAVR